MSGRVERAVPVLQVADVGRSIDWYGVVFAFGLDGYRICVSGPVPAGANVPAARERQETAR